MNLSPNNVLEEALKRARESGPPSLPHDFLQQMNIIVENAETHKAVLGATITSIAYKCIDPDQDIRYHQENMKNGYSARTFDTKYVTPFLQRHFPHFAMAESAWLTRSIEQPHPFTLDFPGRIRNATVKNAFLKTIDTVQSAKVDPFDALVMLLFQLNQKSEVNGGILSQSRIEQDWEIPKIVEAVSRHIYFEYGRGFTGTARIPVIAMYSIYRLLITDVKRYEGKSLVELQAHTSPDLRSKLLGDIQVNNPDGTCFEAVEIKHLKPITSNMIRTAFRKIKNTQIECYYLLTTSDPNLKNEDEVIKEIEALRKKHSCQIILNGVIPSVKYYLRLVRDPVRFLDEYEEWLRFDYRMAGGLKQIHLAKWDEIRKLMLSSSAYLTG